MKRLAILILFCAACSGVALAQWAAVLGASRASGGPVYLLQQDFTNGSGATPGAPTYGGSWTVGGGTWVFNNTSPALPQGGNNAKTNDTFGGRCYANFTGQTECWGYIQLQFSALPLSNYEMIHWQLSDGTDEYRIELHTDGTLKVLNANFDGVSAQTVDGMSINTNYQIWFHYKAGASSNGVMDVGFSTNGTRPTSGNKFAQATTSTLNVTIARIELLYPATTGNFYFDHVLCNNAQIGDNP
jgi:hypothetical protein